MPEQNDDGCSDRRQGVIAPPADQNLYRNLVENSLGLICSHDLEGTISMVNRAVTEALGYKQEEIQGQNFRKFIDPDLWGRFDRYLAHIRRHGTARGYVRLATRTGDRVTWLYRNCIYHEAGKPPIVLGHAQDMTWRFRIEQGLRNSNDNYRRLFEDAPVAYHEIDCNGIVVKLNRAECELL